MSGAPPLLVLFDIDGTLLRGATRAHAQALLDALEEVHGVHEPRRSLGVDPAGRTDSEIARLILLQCGVSATRIDERAADVIEVTNRRHVELLDEDLSHTVLPGVVDLLGELSARDDVLLSLVTGNFESVARLKLKYAGIGHFFPAGQGGFGSDSEDRADLPAIARRRAAHHPRERTVVVGDTRRDIACARADEIECIAVATGPVAADELAGADAVADDMAGVGALLRERYLG